MSVRFPSVEFFTALQGRMREAAERFRRLGYFDTTFAVCIRNGTERSFVLRFEVFDCADVREVKSLADEPVDFILEGGFDAWREMLDNIRSHGQADANHTITTLTHFAEKMRVPSAAPAAQRSRAGSVERIRRFFDVAAGLDVDYGGGETQTAVSA